MRKSYINWSMKYPPWKSIILRFKSKYIRCYDNLHCRFNFLVPYCFDFRYDESGVSESEIVFNIEPTTPTQDVNKLTSLLKRRKSLTYLGLM